MIIKNKNDALDILSNRLNLIIEARKSHTLRKKIINNCRDNIFYWLENFCYTYDPRPRRPKNLPFLPYDFQKELIQDLVNAINNGEDILIEKSRDMGVTWCVIYVLQWYWQFHDGYNFHLGSKKKDNVDRIGDMSTLYGKLRYNLRLQPP